MVGNHLPSRQHYFKKGINWSALTSGGFSGRYCDEGFVFDTKGSSCFFKSDEELLYLYPFMNSKISDMLLLIISPTLDFNCGAIAKLPIIRENNDVIIKEIKQTCQECIEKGRSDWDSFETSWDFKKHPLI